MSKEIKHYGIPRKSGRYPWGSGKDPQRSKDFLSYVEELKAKGMSNKEIADAVGMSTGQLINKKSLAKAAKKKEDIAFAIRLKDKGYSQTAIAERLGRNESTIRYWLKENKMKKPDKVSHVMDQLKKSIDKDTYIDVGLNIERHLGVSRGILEKGITKLKDEGYKIHYIKTTQLGTGKPTTVLTMTKDDIPYMDVYRNRDKIKLPNSRLEISGNSVLGLKPVQSVSSKGVKIRYHEEGGSEKDGVIELRRGLESLNLGKNRYAQVRIGVDNKYFMKGMAIYNDDMPPGVNIIYNVNKKKGTPKEECFKKMKTVSPDSNIIDKDNPFGSSGRQIEYKAKDGSIKTSALFIVNEEGKWGEWSKSLSSQILSKQRPTLAKKQLDAAYQIQKEEFDEIMSLTNPVVKRKLLREFSDSADAAAVHLKAAALPRQASQVLMPIPEMKTTEVYAPNYRHGEKVVLIRHPHGGTFEIPELTVNNKVKAASKILGRSKDAVGINAKVAEILSGADFDGDSVLTIPNNQGYIKTTKPLKGLQNFNPREQYKAYEGMPKMSAKTKGLEMGKVSNLITDMTIKRANPDEIAQAVRHSMVVIDAEKHHLNYKQSHIDNNIANLKLKYQGGKTKGASTLISRASSEERVPYRTDVYGDKGVDPKTGKKLYKYSGDTYVTKSGKVVEKQIKSTKMYEVDDARALSSGTIMEDIYATHANKLKGLGNQARKEMISTKTFKQNPNAKKVYENEVKSLDIKLDMALKNSPLERRAQNVANAVFDAKKKANPHLEGDDLKKLKGQALAEARVRVGAKKTLVEITPKEWEAIQANAISNTKLIKILDNTDPEIIKSYATPRTSITLTPAKINRAKILLDAGNTQSAVADALGVSVNLIKNIE